MQNSVYYFLIHILIHNKLKNVLVLISEPMITEMLLQSVQNIDDLSLVIKKSKGSFLESKCKDF